MKLFVGLLIWLPAAAAAQVSWKNVDTSYAPLPKSVHVFAAEETLDGAPFRAYYLVADLKDKKLDFTTDTTYKRRLTPREFYEKNDHPLVVVNGTFFSFDTHQNLNVVVRDGKVVGFNIHTLPGRGKDTLTYRHPFGSALGIDKKRRADVAWLLTDSTQGIWARQHSVPFIKDSIAHPSASYLRTHSSNPRYADFKKWKMRTAIGGGPVLVQDGKISISNNEELKFQGKAIHDKHPRTAMGYTKDRKLVILVVEGRNPDAAGVTLTQLAKIMVDLGCHEALNLDGGGSSCLLINGRETIRPSDKKQRAVPGVMMIRLRG